MWSSNLHGRVVNMQERLIFMFRKASLVLAVLPMFALFSMSVCPAMSDGLADAGKKIYDRSQNAVVIVQITTKSTASFDGRSPMSHEDKSDATGVIIDPSGLLVMALSETSLEGMMSQVVGDGEDGPKISSDITDMKVFMSDGKQIAYKIVLRDKDLDLAFLRPAKTPSAPFVSIDLTKASKPALLDELVFLDRLSIVASRGLGAFPARINAIVQKPRTFYVSGASGLGAPVFTLDGNIVGIVVLRGMPGVKTSRGPAVMPIIIPAGDVLDAAKQAPLTVQ